MYTYMCADIYGSASHLLDQRPCEGTIEATVYVLASHECSPLQLDLPTAETDFSSVGNNSVWSKVSQAAQ